jgi:DNA-binding transcriptional LysR family regulator
MSLALDDIKNFVKISETLNITRASEILGMSQPTLSYSLKRLEKEIGSKLIVRLKNGIQLTKTGEEFKKRAYQLILNWEDAQNILTEDNQEVKGEFSIGIHPSVALYCLGPILNSLLTKFPLINFDLQHGLSREMVNKVINWEIDFAIAINPIEHPDLVIKELGKDIVTLFKTKKSNDKIICDPSLAQSQFVLKKMKSAKIQYSGFIHSSNLEVITSLTAQGLGIGLLPSRVAAAHSKLEKLTHAPEFKDSICLVYRKDKHQNYISKKIIRNLREVKI